MLSLLPQIHASYLVSFPPHFFVAPGILTSCVVCDGEVAG